MSANHPLRLRLAWIADSLIVAAMFATTVVLLFATTKP